MRAGGGGGWGAVGTVLLNEVAPRVHNSGHVTMDACECSQFEMHLRAITGLPLGSAALKVCKHTCARGGKGTGVCSGVTCVFV
jgi:phosphoribosylaminoimidazole carboxylase (NCAIR synthetase)